MVSTKITIIKKLVFLALFASIVFMVAASHGEEKNFLTQALDQKIFWELRLPHVVNAFLCGSLLALAGVIMQVLLRNPLADPYILGIASGASLMSLIAIILNLAFLCSEFAFLGALSTIFLVFTLTKRKPSHTLLLTGVVIASGLSAITTFILTISPEKSLKGMLFWLIGDLNNSDFSLWPIITLIIGLAFSMWLAPQLNLLRRGEMQANTLGLNSKNLILKLYFLGALLTAAAVSIAGPISFIGLMVPHITRLLFGSDHRLLLPASFLFGGTLLVAADALARTLLTPIQLPVGVVTAFLGVPLFLILLYRSK